MKLSWPSVAVGTFGGVVDIVDSYGTADGKFRVLIRPDENDQAWPEPRYLRQGVRTTGWLLLDEVPLWFEVWRQLNAFPPTVTPPEDGAPKLDKGAGGGKKEKAK